MRDLMGHSEVRTTNIYVTRQFDEMRRAVDALGQQGKTLAFKTG